MRATWFLQARDHEISDGMILWLITSNGSVTAMLVVVISVTTTSQLTSTA